METLKKIALIAGCVVLIVLAVKIVLNVIAGVWALAVLLMPIAILALVIILIVKAVKK